MCVFSVWKVKSLQFQLVSTSKKRKLGENLFTEDQELEEVVPRDWESYLDRLQILLTAYALAGVQAVAGSPPANSENTVGADTTQFVQAPLEGEATPSLGSLQESSLLTLRLWRICLRGLTRRYLRLSSFVDGGACQWMLSWMLLMICRTLSDKTACVGSSTRSIS